MSQMNTVPSRPVLWGSGPRELQEPHPCCYKYTGLGLPRAGSRKWIHAGIFILGQSRGCLCLTSVHTPPLSGNERYTRGPAWSRLWLSTNLRAPQHTVGRAHHSSTETIRLFPDPGQTQRAPWAKGQWPSHPIDSSGLRTRQVLGTFWGGGCP